MKKKLTIGQYIIYLLVESFLFLLALDLILNGLIHWNLETSFRNFLLASVSILGITYFILKLISQVFTDKPLCSMLPIKFLSYSTFNGT